MLWTRTHQHCDPFTEIHRRCPSKQPVPIAFYGCRRLLIRTLASLSLSLSPPQLSQREVEPEISIIRVFLLSSRVQRELFFEIIPNTLFTGEEHSCDNQAIVQVIGTTPSSMLRPRAFQTASEASTMLFLHGG